MTIVLRITLLITATKRQVVKAAPWIKTVSGNPGIRSASLYQVDIPSICVREKPQIHPVQKLLFFLLTPLSVIF